MFTKLYVGFTSWLVSTAHKENEKGQGTVEYIALGGALVAIIASVVTFKDEIAEVIANSFKSLFGS